VNCSANAVRTSTVEQASAGDVLAVTATVAVMHAAFIITRRQKNAEDESVETRKYS